MIDAVVLKEEETTAETTMIDAVVLKEEEMTAALVVAAVVLNWRDTTVIDAELKETKQE